MVIENGEQIRALIIRQRRRQGMTIQELAKRSGLRRGCINNVLYRKQESPTPRTFLPILHALGLELVIVRRKNEEGDA